MPASFFAIVFLVLFGILAGCTKSGSDEKTVTIIQSRADGGIDSSGGNLSRSTQAEVEQALKDALIDVPVAYHRLSYIYYSHFFRFNNDEPNHRVDRLQGLPMDDAKEGHGTDEPATNYNTYRSDALEKILAPANRASVQAVIRGLKTHFSEQPCPSEHGDSDASILGDDVCLHAPALRRLPPSELQIELKALLAHEIAHRLDEINVTEDDANAIQTSLLDAPAIVSARSHWEYQELARRNADSISRSDLMVIDEYRQEIGYRLSRIADAAKWFRGWTANASGVDQNAACRLAYELSNVTETGNFIYGSLTDVMDQQLYNDSDMPRWQVWKRRLFFSDIFDKIDRLASPDYYSHPIQEVRKNCGSSAELLQPLTQELVQKTIQALEQDAIDLRAALNEFETAADPGFIAN